VRKLSSRGGGDAQGLYGTGHVVAEVDVFITGFLSSFPVFRQITPQLTGVNWNHLSDRLRCAGNVCVHTQIV
jgi:hypothetical protein